MGEFRFGGKTADHKITPLDELLPWRYASQAA